MECNVKIKKQLKLTEVQDLEKLTKEELINKIRSLEAHNTQLQNILAKTSNTNLNKTFENTFDFSNCRFRHILLKFFYLGWNYQGFVVQEDTTNTVEHHLFNALIKTCLIKDRSSSKYHRCGRTDKGVSSFGQTISLSVRSKLSEKNEDKLEMELDYCRILNRVLPENIKCLAWAPVHDEFSARFDCLNRTYKYYFLRGNLDIESMHEASKYLIGSHDFRNFCKMDVGNGVVQFVRNIIDFKIEPLSNNNERDIFVAQIKGNAFLWHQIRYIMGILFLIGSKKEDVTIIKELLNIQENSRKPEYNMANEVPLNLFECEYDGIHWYYSKENLKNVIEKCREMQTYKEIKTVMIGDILKQLYELYGANGENDLKCFSEYLIDGVKKRKYVPVMERKKCDSLEERIRHFTKRKRIEEQSASSS